MNEIGDQSEDSQATQLLDNVLLRRAPADRSNVGRQAVNDGGEELLVDPSHSSGSSTRSSLPQYHFHGLVPTQVETQVDAHLNGEGSQKENTPASPDKSTPQTIPSSPHVRVVASHKPSSSTRPERQRVLPARNGVRGTSPSKSTRAPPQSRSVGGARQQSDPSDIHTPEPLPLLSPEISGLPAPHASKTTTRENRPHAPSFRQLDRGHSPFPAPQLSSAGPSLSEVSARPTQALSEPSDPNSNIRPLVATPSSRAGAMVFHSPRRRVAPPTPSRLPSADGVLVAATPTNSNSSIPSSTQSQATQLIREQLESQQSRIAEEVFMSDDLPQAQTMNSDFEDVEEDRTTQLSSAADASTEPSSSYERLLAVNPFEESPHLQATQQATQEVSQQSNGESELSMTQPVTQDDPPSIYSARALARQGNPSVLSGPQQLGTNTTTTTTAPRGRSLIPPGKAWRYRKHEGAGRAVVVPSNLQPSTSAAFRGHVQITQPSQATAVNGSATSRPLTRTSVAQPTFLPPAPQPRDNDDLDVVPDSEPPVPEIHLSSSPSAPLSAALPRKAGPTTIHARVTCQTDQNTDIDDSADLVPETVREEEEEEEESDDVPLVKVVTTLPQSRVKEKAVQLPPEGLTALNPAQSSIDLPSFSPQREAATPVARARTKTPAARGPLTAPQSAVLSARSATRASTAFKQPQDDFDANMSDLTPDDATELADDDDPSKPVRGGKRKRAPTGTKKTSARSTRKASKTASTLSSSRHNKRMKPSNSDFIEDLSSATRVFALWRDFGGYYSGTIHSLAASSTTRYKVNFDDGLSDVVDIGKMRLCQLFIGDHVVLQSGRVAKVAAFNDCGKDDIVTVNLHDGDGTEVVDLQMAQVKIAARTINVEWKTRLVAADSIRPMIRPKDSETSPAPSKLTIRSAGSAKSTHRPLEKSGFVVTLSAGNDNWEAEKDQVMQNIKTLGGTIIEDWSNIFTLDGLHRSGNKRWQLRKEDVRWTNYGGINRVLLLSDAPSQKPKYLIALALGIPCISVEWLRNMSPEGDNWCQYLLPAGYSEALDARVSQLVDMDWGNSIHCLKDVMSNPVPPKVFSGKSILCVGLELFPLPIRASRRTVADLERANQATRQVPKILLCMGASVVEAVSEVKHAFHRNLDEYDFVVVKEGHSLVHAVNSVNCVDLPWVKDCLTAGRLLPQPSPRVF